MKFYFTIPEQPDWHEIYKEYCYKIGVRITFMDHETYDIVADLNEYYSWAKENNISMHHNCIRIPSQGNQKGLISFMFKEQTHAMAFKLRWK